MAVAAMERKTIYLINFIVNVRYFRRCFLPQPLHIVSYLSCIGNFWGNCFPYFFFFFCLFRITPAGFRNSQARGQIWVTAASLHHSHSNRGSKMFLRSIPGNAGYFTHWVRLGIKPASLWILIRFITTEPRQEIPGSFILHCRKFKLRNVIFPVWYFCIMEKLGLNSCFLFHNKQ